MKKALELVAGSITIYMLVAACAAEERSRVSSRDGESSGGPGSSGAPSSSGSSGAGVLDPVPEAMAEDGTRLKARYLRSPDGARQWAGTWTDAERGEECIVREAADGKQRCLPNRDFGYSGGGYFSDRDCSSPLLQQPADAACAPTKYIFIGQAAGCGSPFAGTGVYLSSSAERQGMTYRREAAGACVENGMQTPTTRYHELTEVPPTAFAEMAPE